MREMALVKINIFTKEYAPAMRYSFALLASFLAFLISDFLFPLFQGPVFILPIVAVMVSALYGGLEPGLLATLFSGASFVYYFLPLTLHPSAHSTVGLIRLGLFLLLSLLVNWVSASYRSAYRRAEASRIEAEEANRYKSRLVSSVSHDLRTPLNAIIGYNQLLLNGTYGPIAEDQRTPLKGIQRNAGGLLNMVNDILDLSRMESGKTSITPAPVEIPLLIQEILSEIQPLSDQKALPIRCRFPPTLPCIESDEMKLKQILVNLLSNAIKFTDQGELTIAAENRRAENGIEISVQDTGIGIQMEVLPKIFEMFYQVDETKSTQGSGLGLAIVKNLVHLLKGKIEVNSEYGKGSTFTLFLPYRFSS